MNFFRRIVKHIKGEETATGEIDNSPRDDAYIPSNTTQYYRRSRNISDEASINVLRVSCVPDDKDVRGISQDHPLKDADSSQILSRTGTSDLYDLDWSRILIKEDSDVETLKYGRCPASGCTDSVSSKVNSSNEMLYGVLENEKTKKEDLRHSESIASPFSNDVKPAVINSREISKDVSGKITLTSSINDTPKQVFTKDALENQESGIYVKLSDSSTSTKTKVESLHDRNRTSFSQENQISEILGKTKSQISTGSKAPNDINWEFKTERKSRKSTERPNEITCHLPTKTNLGDKILPKNVKLMNNANDTNSSNVKLFKEREETETKYRLSLKSSRSKENVVSEPRLNCRGEHLIEAVSSSDNLPNTFYDLLGYSTSNQNASEMRTSPWKEKEIIADIGRPKNDMNLSYGKKESDVKKANEISDLNIKSDNIEKNKQDGKMNSQNELASQLKMEEDNVRMTHVEHSRHYISAQDTKSDISSQDEYSLETEIKLDACKDMYDKLACRSETPESENVTKTTCGANSCIENNSGQYQETIVDMSGVNTSEVEFGMIDGSKISQKDEYCVKSKINIRDSTTTDCLKKRSKMSLGGRTCSEVTDLKISKQVIRDVVASSDLYTYVQPPAEQTKLDFGHEKETSKTSHDTLIEELNLNEHEASTVILDTENINSGLAQKAKSVKDDVLEKERSTENALYRNSCEISSTVEMKEPKRKLLKDDIYKNPKENTLTQQSYTVKTNNQSIVASFESKADSSQGEQEKTQFKDQEQQSDVSDMWNSAWRKQKSIEEVWSLNSDVHGGPRVKRQSSSIKANTKSHLNAISVDIEMKKQIEEFNLLNESVSELEMEISSFKTEKGQQPKTNISTQDTQTNISPHDQISCKTRQKPFSLRDEISGTALQPCKNVLNETNPHLGTENVTKPKHGASSCIRTNPVEYQETHVEISRSYISETGFRVNNENVDDSKICQNHEYDNLSDLKPYDLSYQKTWVEDLTNMSGGQMAKHVSEFKMSTDVGSNVIASCNRDSTVQLSVGQKQIDCCLDFERLKTKHYTTTAESIVQKELASTVTVSLESVNIVQTTEKKKSSGKDELIKKETLTENVRKPEKLILEIFNCDNIYDYQSFLQDRIGISVKFTIEDIIEKQNSTNLIVQFPSKTSSRKVTEILHLRNCECKTIVKCHFYEEQRKRDKRRRNAKAEASPRNSCEKDVTRETTPDKQKKSKDQSRSQTKLLSATQSTAFKIDNQRIQTNSESGTSGYHAKEKHLKVEIVICFTNLLMNKALKWILKRN